MNDIDNEKRNEDFDNILPDPLDNEENLYQKNNENMPVDKFSNIDTSVNDYPPFVSDINENKENDIYQNQSPNYQYNAQNQIPNNFIAQTPMQNTPNNYYQQQPQQSQQPQQPQQQQQPQPPQQQPQQAQQVQNTANTNADNNIVKYDWDYSKMNNQEEVVKPKSKVGPIIVAIFCFALLVFIVFNAISDLSSEVDPTNVDNEESSKSNISITEVDNLDDGLSTKEIYKKVSKSVVGIQTFDPINYGSTPLSEGSGVIMSEDGMIITNSHVIKGGKTIKVTFLTEDDSEVSYEAKLVGHDARTDLAVIKLTKIPSDLVVAEFGDSEALEIGERIIAIGNPGGTNYAGSITQGIVSGVDRKVSDREGFSIAAIQVDAAINPGNSGGALINIYGQVVGITSSKLSGDYYEGMGFALPMHKAQPILDLLIKDGRIAGRPIIGITYEPDKFIDAKTAQDKSLETGIVIYQINEESDAYAKGLRPNDIIHEIDGVVLQSVNDVSDSIEGKKPGDFLSLVVYRSTSQGELKEMFFDIELMEDVS